MIYVIPKNDDKPVKVVYTDKWSDPIVEDGRVYVVNKHPSPKEIGEALKTLRDRLMSESTLADEHMCPDEVPSSEEIEDLFIPLNEMLKEMEEEDMGY